METFNIFWELDVSSNPFVSVTVNSVAYEGNWNDVIAMPGSPLSTVMSNPPDEKPTATAQGSDSADVTLTVTTAAGSVAYPSKTYGGSRPTW